jgi:HK97 family phage portal protein
MGLIEKMLQPFRKHSPKSVQEHEEKYPPRNILEVEPEAMLRVAWVYSCVNAISEAVKETPWKTYRGEDGDDEITGGPLYKLLRSPNPFYSGRKLWELTSQWLEIHGNAYWWLEGVNEKGVPTNIWLLDPRNMIVVPDRQTFIKGYIHELAGKQTPLDYREVIHFKKANPFNPYYGLGTLQGGALTIQTEQQRQEYETKFFENGAAIAGILTAPETVPDHVFERIKKEWRLMHKGVKNAHRIALLEHGVEFKPTGMTQKDMEFVDLARLNRDQILAMFRVPPSKLGLVEDANRSNSQGQDVTFWEKISSLLSDLEDTLNTHPTITAMRAQYGEYVRFDEVVKEDVGAKVDQVAKLANLDILDRNELREWLGYKPVKEDPEQPDNDPEPEDDETEKGIRKMNEDELSPQWKSVRNTFHAYRDRRVNHFTRSYKPDIQEFFDEQELRLLSRMRAAGLLKMTGPTDPEEILSQVWDEELENGELLSLLSVLHIEVAKEAYERVADIFFDQDVRFSPSMEPEHAKLIEDLGKKITRINETTRKRIAEEIREGLYRGYSIQQIAEGVKEEDYKGISGVFEMAKGYRAEMIARSETADAYNLANLLTYKDLGQTEVEVIDGEFFDEHCRQANGQVWPITKAQAEPKDHPNCTRAFAPHFSLDGLTMDKKARREGDAWELRALAKMHAHDF